MSRAMAPLGTKTSAGQDTRRVRRWRIAVTAGPSKGLVLPLTEGIVRVGSADTNEIVLKDPKISRVHIEVEVLPTGLRVRDLHSKNGTFFQGSRVGTVELPIAGAVLTLGASELAFQPDDPPVPVSASVREQCGRLLGRSLAIRDLFGQIERVALSDATVLIHGETGTGKELVAEAIHELSPRSAGPFVVVDCGAIPRELIESELFGHVKGAFTGAAGERRGAFERAHGGTIFLDEIGELALDLQPKLLRVLEASTVKPVGGDKTIKVDVRVVAASLRDLREATTDKRFREDLYFRLSVVNLEVPPLRAHLEDVPLLVDHFLRDLHAAPLAGDSLATLSSYAWPGNVRQLRNVVERAVALAGAGAPVVRPDDREAPAAQISPSKLFELPYKIAKDEMLAQFTREYLEALLGRHAGNVSAAAREAKIDRNWIVALARRHGVRVRE
jgi:transcriptional regulator with GAF, ATPase, and Fis domain